MYYGMICLGMLWYGMMGHVVFTRHSYAPYMSALSEDLPLPAEAQRGQIPRQPAWRESSRAPFAAGYGACGGRVSRAARVLWHADYRPRAAQ